MLVRVPEQPVRIQREAGCVNVRPADAWRSDQEPVTWNGYAVRIAVAQYPLAIEGRVARPIGDLRQSDRLERDEYPVVGLDRQGRIQRSRVVASVRRVIAAAIADEVVRVARVGHLV